MSEPIFRTDLLAHAMNPGKEREVLAVHRAWRRCAPKVAGEQWRLFFQEGGFNKNYRNPDEGALAEIAGAADRVQMIRYRVVETLKSFVSNRQRDFRRRVMRMTADELRRPWFTEELRHELLIINSWRAWFHRRPLVTGKGEEIRVSPFARDVAHWLMRDIFSHHRMPDLSHGQMLLDVRAVKLSEAIDPEEFWARERLEWEERQAERERKREKAGNPARKKKPTWTRKSRKREAPKTARTKKTVFQYWAKLPTMTPGKTLWAPLLVHERFLDRSGKLKGSIQVNVKNGRIYFGLLKDVSEAFEAERNAYTPKVDEIALDWGLRTMFATDTGDLLGRRFLLRLKQYDRRITKLAAYRQKHGGKVRSPRYDREVQRLRGFLRSEVGRVLNRLVERRRPGRIIVERLDFRSPALSRRLNRILSNSGRSIVKEKLKALEEQYGIETHFVPAAYSSQECSSCGYVDKKNRTGEQFRCLWCGKTVHADVNAPRNLRTRRTRTFRDEKGETTGRDYVTKACVLRTLVYDFMRQCAEIEKVGRRGTSRDPRPDNPYFKQFVGGTACLGDLKRQ